MSNINNVSKIKIEKENLKKTRSSSKKPVSRQILSGPQLRLVEKAKVLKAKIEKARVEKAKAEKSNVEKSKAEKPKVRKLKVEKSETEKPNVGKPKVENTNVEKSKVEKQKAAKSNDNKTFLPAVIEKKQNLPAIPGSGNVVSASQLLSKRFAVSYSTENYEKSVRELSMVMIGIVSFILISFIGWKVSREINFVNGGDFIYNTGLIGGILMLLTLPYSIIKRISFLSRRSSSTHSYYMHIACGGIGALLIVIHSSFDFRSINSSVAIIAMVLILISGALGRYLYTHFSLLLHRMYIDVKSTEPEFYNSFSVYNCSSTTTLTQRLSNFVQYSFNQPSNFFEFLVRCFSVTPRGLYTYVVSSLDIYKIIRSASKSDQIEKQKVKETRKNHKNELREYIIKITKMGYLNLLEQLVKHWRMLHVPFLYILFITSIVHVLVVHMY